jgi:hypothetical protein
MGRAPRPPRSSPRARQRSLALNSSVLRRELPEVDIEDRDRASEIEGDDAEKATEHRESKRNRK